MLSPKTQAVAELFENIERLERITLAKLEAIRELKKSLQPPSQNKLFEDPPDEEKQKPLKARRTADKIYETLKLAAGREFTSKTLASTLRISRKTVQRALTEMRKSVSHKYPQLMWHERLMPSRKGGTVFFYSFERLGGILS